MTRPSKAARRRECSRWWGSNDRDFLRITVRRLFVCITRREGTQLAKSRDVVSLRPLFDRLSGHERYRNFAPIEMIPSDKSLEAQPRLRVCLFYSGRAYLLT